MKVGKAILKKIKKKKAEEKKMVKESRQWSKYFKKVK